MKVSEFRKLIREEVRRVMEESQPVYRYDFVLSRGLSYDNEEETSKEAMVNFIEEMWDEQGPSGYDMMQIYATKNTSTKDPVVIVELEDAIVLYSTIRLSESVAMATAKRGSQGIVIEPNQVVSHLKLV